LHFGLQGGPHVVTLTPHVVAIAGYTGRDRESVRRHVDELAQHGIAPPARVPMVYAVTPDRVVTGGPIEVLGTHTSGEVEFVLLLVSGEILVGVGSDHTDRELEKHDIAAAKQCCPKVIGPELWRLDDLDGHWDRLRLRSWIGSEHEPYQDGTVDALMRPRDILAVVQSHAAAPLKDSMIFCGTLPLLDGVFRPSTRFEAELYDPLHERRLTCSYDVAPLHWLRD
jgi:hypothetical protein